MINYQLIKTKLIAIATATTFAPIILNATPAQASFGDFMLGVGTAAGASVIINNNRRARENRYRPVPPEQEYARGLQDGLNGARYDNPRNSPDYNRGFQEGIRRRGPR